MAADRNLKKNGGKRNRRNIFPDVYMPKWPPASRTSERKQPEKDTYKSQQKERIAMDLNQSKWQQLSDRPSSNNVLNEKIKTCTRLSLNLSVSLQSDGRSDRPSSNKVLNGKIKKGY